MKTGEILLEVLNKAGWYSGRRLEVENIIGSNQLPRKVCEFYSEFGGVKIKRKGLVEMIIYKLSPNIVNAYLKLLTELLSINVNNDDYEYYYSILLGTPIFEIACSIQDPGDHFFIDANGRFYYLSTIPQFFWFGDNPIDALSKLLLFGGESAVLDEEALKWNVRKNEESKYQLPINTNLKTNPWF